MNLIRSFGLQLLDSDPLGWTIRVLIRDEMNERDPARTLNESRRMICLDDLSVCEGLRCVNVFHVVVCCGSVCREAKLINNSKKHPGPNRHK